MSFFGNIKYEIRDAQYREAVSSTDDLLISSDLPKPTSNELKRFIEASRVSIKTVIKSPIGVYYFSEYLKKFANNLSLVEYYIQHRRVAKLKYVPTEELEYLLLISRMLPMPFQDDLEAITNKIEETNRRNLSLQERTSAEAIMLSYHEEELCLDFFEGLFTKVERKSKDLFSTFILSEEFQEMMRTMWYASQTPGPTDFIRFRVLGTGAFGVVTGVKHKITGQLCAVKTMNRKVIKGKQAMSIIGAEKSVLQKLGNQPSPFAICLKFAFEDKDNFYMALPLCTGGDLSFHLAKKGPFGLELSRFYCAEIFEGIRHLHNLGIIYRDLKPENVILDQTGHCKISDMGLAVQSNGKKFKGRAGTPGYWAPEVFEKGVPYSYSSDYWSLGICLFEFLIGVCPLSEAICGMPRNVAILKWKIKYPKQIYEGNSPEKIDVPDEFRSFLKGLLNRDPIERLRAEDIEGHPIFKTMNWEMLRILEVTPPFIPPKDEINASRAQNLESTEKTKQYASVKLEDSDKVENFEFVARIPYEMEIVNALLQTKDEEEEDEAIMNTYYKQKVERTSFKPFEQVRKFQPKVSTTCGGICTIM